MWPPPSRTARRAGASRTDPGLPKEDGKDELQNGPILATASVTGEVLGTPNATMKKQLGKGEPKLFTPWIALQDQGPAAKG